MVYYTIWRRKKQMDKEYVMFVYFLGTIYYLKLEHEVAAIRQYGQLKGYII